MISGLLNGLRLLGRLPGPMWRQIARRLTHPKVMQIAVEFLTEAAVLVFVFPVLDTVVQIDGAQKVTFSLVFWSVAIALLFLALAAIISTRGGE